MSDQVYPDEAVRRAQKLKALLLDVDGVMTDGRIIFDSKGRDSRNFNVQDGLGVYFAKKCGLIVGIITGRKSRVTKIRARELKIDFLSQGHKNKLKPYEKFKVGFNLTDEEIGYIGDDLLDLSIMSRCGFSACVANGREEVKAKSHFVTNSTGGKGAVREVIEFVLKQQGKWQKLLDNYYENFDRDQKQNKRFITGSREEGIADRS